MGIEFSWGLSKRSFRRNNDCVFKNLHKNILNSISADVITPESVFRFARRTREYHRAYWDIFSQDIHEDRSEGYELVEKMKKLQKSHRNILDLEASYLKAMEREFSNRVIISEPANKKQKTH